MHVLLLAAAIALTGQVSGDGGPRYPANPAAEGTTASGDVVTAQEQPASQQVLPPGQPATTYPEDSNFFESAEQELSLQSDAVATTNDSAEKIKPSQLIRSLLKTPLTGELPGSPLSLVEAVQGASSRNEQTNRVEAYWDLSAAVADYYISLREVTDFQTLRQSVLQPSDQWEQVRQILDQRGQAARRTARAAQVRLQGMIGRSDRVLPLPSDFPHCGQYNTRYEEIFTDRTPSLEAQLLHELLPLKHQDLHRQAASVVAAHQWLDTVSLRRNPDTDGSGLLKAHELLSLRRRAFVFTLSNYNTSIARYAEIAIPGKVDTERLVAMLIQTVASQTTAQNNLGIRLTGAEETVDPRATTGQPDTYTKGRWGPAQLRKGAEHSILRRPSN